MNPSIDLEVEGPTEEDWMAVCEHMPTFIWPACHRVVVVSPHPDDESLGCGGLIATAVQRGHDVMVIAVTDGEAATQQVDLGRTRRAELADALSCLAGDNVISRVHLGLPDGRVADDVPALGDAIAALIEPTDLVVCPIIDDGHPDHAAVSRAATTAARRVGCPALGYPVWAWHCHVPSQTSLKTATRLPLADDVLSRKRAAVSCHRSQLEGRDPVVPPAMLARLLRPFEVVVTLR
ncbi:MAG: hypothetical protein JWL72_2568 [Ilumatobacteraceae bacterium]|nr:hypothetical protein [Ilumatobacteraceae bacterium]MCU1389230.1 hypothetical protein [Ilumatobacteraceae bacterium]